MSDEEHKAVGYLKINPIRELLRAGLVVGLHPKEMTLNVLEELKREAKEDSDA